MRLYEHEAKTLLADAGVPVTRGILLPSPDAPLPAGGLPPLPWVVKSQVLSGGRMKAGGVLFADSAEAGREAAARLWTHRVGALLPAAVLVEPKVAVAAEHYLAVTYDQRARRPVFAFAAAGGIDVEAHPEAVVRARVPVLEPFADFTVRDALAAGGVGPADLPALTRIGAALVRAFLRHDLLLAELNPLARVADGSFLALDAHVEVDDDALGRQPGLLARLGIADPVRQDRPPTPFEREAQAVDAADHRGVAGRVVEFDGPLGLVIGGGGASLAAFDAVRRHGGRPANYCEIGGNPSVGKVAGLTRLLLGRPGVERIAVIMNVVNNTRSDLVARGVLRGIVEAGREPRETLAVFRVPGAGEDESRALLAAWGVEALGREVSIDEAARRAVERA
jgi:succinyl-CoA synthetase beta subunit